MNDMANHSKLTYLFKPVENKVPCGGFNFVGGGVIGKDFVVNSGQVTIEGYYDIEDCVEVKGTTNIYRCDNLKFTTFTSNTQVHLIFDNHVTSIKELSEALFKYLQDNCITWSAIEYLNILLSSLSMRCTGIGVDAVSELIWKSFGIDDLTAQISISPVSEGRLQNSIYLNKAKILTKGVSPDTTTPGLYFTPTGATYIFTKG